SFRVLSASSMTATVPAGTAGIVDVTVTTASGTSATNAVDKFTYQPSAATVMSISPNTGATFGGTTITITGSGFSTATAVYFGGRSYTNFVGGGTPATSFVVNSDTSITAIAPAHGAGAVDVIVVTPQGISATSAVDKFTFAVRGPTYVKISPATNTVQ